MTAQFNTRTQDLKASTSTRGGAPRWPAIETALPQLALLVAVLALLPMPVLAGSTLSPIGTWVTAGGESQVTVEQCGAALCGKIVWLKNPLGDDSKPAVDSKNPKPRLRARLLLGLPLLNGFEPSADDSNVWNGGTIYDPDDGRTYSCKLTMIDPDTLKVRGYVGFSFLGKTQTWKRVGDTR